MTSQFNFDMNTNPQNAALARWLLNIFTPSEEQDVWIEPSLLSSESDNMGALSGATYHPQYYQKLPDLAIALLQNEPRVELHYAPLIFHLLHCATCHTAYLDIYDSLREALQPQETRLQVGQGPRTLAAIPPRMVVHLSQLFISQAEALLKQGRREQRDTTDLARFLLQQAIYCSAKMTQRTMRSRALEGLVRIATLFERTSDPRLLENVAVDESWRAYTLQTSGSGNFRRARRSAHPSDAKDNPVIYLQANNLEGQIVQQGEMLELYLENLDEDLRGHYLDISIPLGRLLKPVQWQDGADPYAIRSADPVDKNGYLSVPLGRTSLKLSNHEDRNLLEALFLQISVRPVPFTA